jgi:hypothetical protein
MIEIIKYLRPTIKEFIINLLHQSCPTISHKKNVSCFSSILLASSQL